MSISGEFAFRSVRLIGNERVFKELLIPKLMQQQEIRNVETGEMLKCQLLLVSGKGKDKTIRFHKSALPILKWLHPEAYDYYMKTFQNHKFSGDPKHYERNHRVAEAIVMCLRAGIEVRPYLLPRIQFETITQIGLKKTSMYMAKELKRAGEMEFNKTIFTRMVGGIFSKEDCYVIYNTRNAVMKWNGGGEIKACQSVTEIARMNIGVNDVYSAILFGMSQNTALKTIISSDSSLRKNENFDSIYRYIHFIPMNEEGIRHLRLFTVPNLKEELLDMLFEPETRSYNRGSFEYDAYIEGTYVYSYLDGDISRLIRFKAGVDYEKDRRKNCEVVCFSYQVNFLREYLGQDFRLKVLHMKVVEEDLGIEVIDLLQKQN